MLRNATRKDIGAIQHLINTNLDKLLPRKDEELLELIDGNTFWIVEDAGEIVGCCCLEVYSAKIAELRSLAVRDDCRGKGYGELLVNAAIEEANRRQIKQVLVVTSTLEFFQKMNFGQCLNEKYALFWNGTTPE
ncbi:MAG: GNAT family N-acetyltransferase [Anaerolineae bacterium]|nr:GNAT family N-acetyltransferase [Anaerolineae bacterium]